jgi:hypothetical protein
MKIREITILSLTSLSLLASCGSSEESVPPIERPPVTAPAPNIAPQVTTSGASQVNEGSSTSISATGTDADGEIINYQWTQVGGSPAITLSDASAATLTLVAPDVDEDTEFSFEVVVTDDDGATASDTFNLTVSNVVEQNIWPQVSLTGPTSMNAGDEAELIANASDDDGQIIQYYWAVGIGDGLPIPLDGEDGSTLTFTAPQVTENTGFTFEVTVIDDKGAATTDSLSILVIANTQAKSRPDSLTVFLLDGVESELISPLANDTTGSEPTLISVGETSLGEVEVNPDGTVLFTPLRNALGTEVVPYTAMDGNVEYQGEITISVEQYVTLAAYAGADGISSFPGASIWVNKHADGEFRFGSTADKSGWFSVGSILKDPEDVFILTVNGSESNGQGAAQLTSILGTAAEILSAAQLEAGNRYVIRESGLPTVRPTHLTTAEEILLSRAIGNQPISDLDLFNEAFQNINATSLIEYAAIIELVAFQNAAIPEGASKKGTDVYTSAKSAKSATTDINSRTLFEEGNEARFTAFAQENEAAIAAGIEEVKAYMLTAGGKKPIGKHMLVLHDKYGPIEGSGLFQFNEDNTGIFDTLSGSSSFTFTLNGNRLEATMNESLPGEDKEAFRSIYPSYKKVLIKKVQFDLITSAREGVRCINGLISYAFYNDSGKIGGIDLLMFNGGISTPRLVPLDSYKRTWSKTFLSENSANNKLVLPVYVDGTWQTDLFTANSKNNTAVGLIFKQEASWSEEDDVLSFAYADHVIEYLLGQDIDSEIVAQLKEDGQIVSTKLMKAPRFVNTTSMTFDLIQSEQVWTKKISETLRSVANESTDGSPALAPRFQNGYRLNPLADGGFGVERLTTQCNEDVSYSRCETWTTNSEEVTIVDGPDGEFIRFNDGVNQDGRAIYRDWYLFELSNSAHVVEVVWEDLNRNGSWSNDRRAYEPITSNPVYFSIDIPYAPLKASPQGE